MAIFIFPIKSIFWVRKRNVLIRTKICFIDVFSGGSGEVQGFARTPPPPQSLNISETKLFHFKGYLRKLR